MKVTLKGDVLTIEVKLGKAYESSTGKSNIRFSSRGFQAIDGKLRANVTVIEKR